MKFKIFNIQLFIMKGFMVHIKLKEEIVAEGHLRGDTIIIEVAILRERFAESLSEQ
jgi:hypothetical protein